MQPFQSQHADANPGSVRAAASTTGAAASALRSRSLARGLELACGLSKPAGSEHLLLGLLLAAEQDKNMNAAADIVCKAGGGLEPQVRPPPGHWRRVPYLGPPCIINFAKVINIDKERRGWLRQVCLQRLQASCGVTDEQRAAACRACPGGVQTFGVHWGAPVTAAAGAAGACLGRGGVTCLRSSCSGSMLTSSGFAGPAAVPAPPQNMRGPVPNTHWVPVVGAGSLLCGQSAGSMSAGQLQDVVAAGVDTFVCLQVSGWL